MKIVLDFVTNSSEDDYYYDYEEEIKQTQSKGRRKSTSNSTYVNHCWRCGNPINGSWNQRCPKCRWYICPNCGACHCNY